MQSPGDGGVAQRMKHWPDKPQGIKLGLGELLQDPPFPGKEELVVSWACSPFAKSAVPAFETDIMSLKCHPDVAPTGL